MRRVNITFIDEVNRNTVEIHARPIPSEPARKLKRRSTYVMEQQKGGGFIIFGKASNGVRVPVGWRSNTSSARSAVTKLNSGLMP